MKRKVIILLIFVCCSMLISSDNQGRNISLKENNINLKTEEVKEAYEYAKNLEVWHSVLMNTQEYSQVAESKIHKNEKLDVYREKEVDSNT
nr:hypothetical protein [Eubacterium sp.]